MSIAKASQAAMFWIKKNIRMEVIEEVTLENVCGAFEDVRPFGANLTKILSGCEASLEEEIDLLDAMKPKVSNEWGVVLGLAVQSKRASKEKIEQDMRTPKRVGGNSTRI